MLEYSVGVNDGTRTRNNQNHNLRAYIKRYMAYKVIHGYFFNFSTQ